jgi:hypothetical protein
MASNLPRLLHVPRSYSRRAKWRFAESRRKAVWAHLGRAPSMTEEILLSRVISLEWQLRQIDAKIDGEIEALSVTELRDLLRTAHSAETRLRMDLTALGMEPKAPPVDLGETTLDDFLAYREVAE